VRQTTPTAQSPAGRRNPIDRSTSALIFPQQNSRPRDASHHSEENVNRAGQKNLAYTQIYGARITCFFLKAHAHRAYTIARDLGGRGFCFG
jgi:hypothetical protein